MSLVINTNVSSLNAQNNLSRSQSALAQATERLSSGLKINSAKDNAAGYAISQRYTTQIGGLQQASANASDAINLAQTAGSALDQVTANLQAIRDLAVQSATGTYSDSDRASIDQEVQQRLAEITRIANQTTFNGSKVLDGSLGTKSFQIGADVGQTISVSLNTSVKAGDMGQLAEVSTGDISGIFGSTTTTTAATAGSSTGSAAPGSFDFSTTNASFTVDGHAVNLTTNVTNMAGLVSAVQGKLDAAAAGTYSVGIDATTGGLKISTTATGAAAAAPVIAGTDASTIFGTVTTAAGQDATTTTTAAPDLSTEGFSINGTAIDLTGVKSLQDLSDAINAAGINGVSAAVSGDGKGLEFYSSAALTIADTGAHVIGANAKDANTSATYAAGTAAAAGGSLAKGSVATVNQANDLISRVDVALKAVSDFAAQLGAVQNRFQSTISTVAAQTTNLQSSQSTIQDADFAAETAALSKAQVLQQAGISVLAQANSQPQQVLKLLQ
ncbi:flagellin [Fulvimonas sp. R45]|uniref:flagellin N-terminal helical domain-containing protein n=1 Tax=Fulvimonas sp. R45 TaxID=3045937 RepID=UPI00265FD74A|nr:flagellin [Fulvimonas sp. R45]MDO1528346.1 flagellin [Fulvimonas sp. R45]